MHNGSTLNAHNLTLGKTAGSVGTVELQTSGANQFGLVVGGDLTVGDAGRGKVTVEGGYSLTTQGEAVMGKQSTSGDETTPNMVTVSGANSSWSISPRMNRRPADPPNAAVNNDPSPSPWRTSIARCRTRS